MKFEWDSRKAASNEQKHGVGFPEATTVFGDPFHYSVSDSKHSNDEERWITIGHSDHGRLLILSHTAAPDLFRIISARKVTSTERADYERRLLEYLKHWREADSE